MKEFCCKDCGTKNSEHFYPKIKGRCKNCTLVVAKEKYENKSKKDKKEYINQQKLYYKNNIVKARYLGLKYRALKKNLDCDITEDYLNQLLINQNNKCYYTQIEFDNSSEVYSFSVDRIDSFKGYTKDNVRLVCSAINYMKAEYSEDLFLALNKAIYLNNFV